MSHELRTPHRQVGRSDKQYAIHLPVALWDSYSVETNPSPHKAACVLHRSLSHGGASCPLSPRLPTSLRPSAANSSSPATRAMRRRGGFTPGPSTNVRL